MGSQASAEAEAAASAAWAHDLAATGSSLPLADRRGPPVSVLRYRQAARSAVLRRAHETRLQTGGLNGEQGRKLGEAVDTQQWGGLDVRHTLAGGLRFVRGRTEWFRGLSTITPQWNRKFQSHDHRSR